ncbi:MAG: Fused isobutyryl-CoA mutase [Phycisphaerae bacterium]|nr:Fused isobutyryl-CoA mutase [Phycisphaerae bacterium]
MKSDDLHHPPRILLAKIGLDGHDRGVKVLARAFRDAGMDVIYTGLWQTCEATMHAALQEDVDVVGVSLLSAAHMTVMPELVRLRRDLGIEEIPLVLGGIVPESDHPKLREIGVAAVFNPGSSMDQITETLRALSTARRVPPALALKEGFERRDVRALARTLTAIQRDVNLGGWGFPRARSASRVLGITGAPGVGKSSFIARISRELRGRGRKVGVVCVDPSSPVTGGALLGDRLRMMGQEPDANFFIRSVSSGRVSDGLGPHCEEIVSAMLAFGFDHVLIETVGAGQADVGIRGLADRVLLVLMPESGDSIQFSKAGIMEIADAFVINKADLPGADASLAQLTGVIGADRPAWKTSTTRGEGFAEVADWVIASTGPA